MSTFSTRGTLLPVLQYLDSTLRVLIDLGLGSVTRTTDCTTPGNMLKIEYCSWELNDVNLNWNASRIMVLKKIDVHVGRLEENVLFLKFCSLLVSFVPYICSAQLVWYKYYLYKGSPLLSNNARLLLNHVSILLSW